MADYDKFAKQYSDSMGENGDEVHNTQIDPYIYKIIGDVNGKVICDLGCGNGYMARYFYKNGAEVFASDVSKELVSIAKEKSKGLNIHYQVHSAEELDNYKDKTFDAVVMNMSIHHIKDSNRLFSGVSRILKDKGIFAFSTNHFFRPHYPYSEWVLDKIEGKETLFIKVTKYLEHKESNILSGWDNKTMMKNYTRTLSDFINNLSNNNLYTFKIYEPEPVNSGQAFSKELQKTHHIPTFIIVGAIKLKDDKISS
jgi:2-polyprenyl-3-methyl-5-hydroxy-6-metoxy-1,4-benzoquinol methylase